MKKAILGVSAVVLVAVAGLVGVVSMQPATTHVERSAVMAASVDDVWPMITDHREFVKWSPWTGLDPDQKTEFSDKAGAVGSWYTWAGNEDVGSGKMTITSLTPGKSVVNELQFIEPWESVADATTSVVPEGDGVKVTWAIDMNNDFMAKAMSLAMNMDDMLGPDFEKGLASLKVQAETAATARIAAEAAEAERKRVDEEAAKMADAEGAEGAAGPAATTKGARRSR